MKVENLGLLKINKLSQAQYDKALQEGKINEDELYLTPDTEYSRYTTVVSSAGTSNIAIGALVENISTLSVYQNGLLLTYGTHYMLNEDNSSIDLIDYTADESDIFTFVFGLIAGDMAGGDVLRGSTTASGGESAITIPLTILSTSGLMVYENGILLEEGKQYTATTEKITLIGYTADAGDVYTFVSGKGIAGNIVTSDASGIKFSSDDFTEASNVEEALVYLKSNLNTGDFVPLTGANTTSNFTLGTTNTLNLSGSVVNLTNTSANTGYTIASTTARIKGNNILFDSSSVAVNKETSVANGDSNVRNIHYSTGAPTSSDTGLVGDLWIVYEE